MIKLLMYPLVYVMVAVSTKLVIQMVTPKATSVNRLKKKMRTHTSATAENRGTRCAICSSGTESNAEQCRGCEFRVEEEVGVNHPLPLSSHKLKHALVAYDLDAEC